MMISFFIALRDKQATLINSSVMCGFSLVNVRVLQES
jgi:hypothetical protein